MTAFDGWHLPGRTPARTRSLDARGAQVRYPALPPAGLAELAADLAQRSHELRALPQATITGAIDTVATRLLDAADPLRAAALEWLPRVTGFSPPMAALVLDRMAADWRAPVLEQLLREELRDPRVLECFRPRGPGRLVRAWGPRLVLHVLSGNVPGVGVHSLIRSLLVRAPALCKTARDEPVLTPLFARALHDAEPRLGEAIAVLYWPGGDVALEAAALAHAEAVVHYGDAPALASLRQRLPAHARLLEHGPRFSFGVVAREAVRDPALPDAIARATAAFDQLGCVSPQTIFVEGNATAARDLARRIAESLQQLNTELPRGSITSDVASAIHAARATAEFRAIAGHDVHLWAGESLSWTVIYDGTSDPGPAALHRTLWLRRLDRLDSLPDLVRPHAARLQSVAVAAGRRRKNALATGLSAAGATRITTFDALPWPPPGWHHDGRGPLRELLRWSDYEPG